LQESEFGERLVAADRRPQRALGHHEGLQRPLAYDLARHRQTGERGAAILRLYPVVRAD
jgi:hypothetical protein